MERRLTAILSADVEGYSRLMGVDEAATLQLLTTCRELLTKLIGQHRGRELGRDEDARAEAAAILRISPEYSLAVARDRLPYKDPATLQRRLDALRRAGLT